MSNIKTHNFPLFDELSFEQKSAVKLDLNRNNLIIGAPGTGKTIVALFRLHELFLANKKKILLLVFNRPLMLYLKMLQKELAWENEFEIYTVNDWAFYKLYSGSVEEPVTGGILDKPVPNVSSSKYKIDWQQVTCDFIDKEDLYDHIVVDEGQDFPVDFYVLLTKISKNVTIFSDPNQSLQDDSTPIADILTIIGKEAYFALTLNYRNSTKITDFTRRYCYNKSIFAESYIDGDDLSIEAVDNDETCIIEKIKSIVAKYDNTKDIGIVVSHVETNDEIEKNRFSNELYDALTKSFDDKEIQLYINNKTAINEKNKGNIDFSEKSIKIFNYMTIRGLDFDVVILIDNLTNKIIDNDDKIDKHNVKLMNRLYVASTRAIEKLYVLPINNYDIDNNKYLNWEIIYSKFPKIDNTSIEECYRLANDYYEKKEYDIALYYYHYLISVIGIVDNKELSREVIYKFSTLCNRFNKSDFALSIINNFAEIYKVYDDKKLTYCYQNSLLDSLNFKKVFDKPDGFFKTISHLEDNNQKESLLKKFFTIYTQKLNGDDKDFAIDYINKHSLSSTKAWKDYRESFNKISDDVNDIELKTIDYDKNNDKTGHELLEGSYILVIAGTHTPEHRFIEKAKEYGFEKDDFEFYLDYDKMTNHDFSFRKMTDKPKAIILGSNPHSLRGRGDYRSLNAMLSEPGYPKLFTGHMGKELSVSLFGRLIGEVYGYLKF